ncbi:CMRF35-like molecule 8 isoform 1-T1 [Dama dama]|uniref:CMRF35-like molecule 8 isoform X1 n=2 Tax=Dama dama TaxID=30532 RepID=UPI002A35E8F3|nr:CMRF35-like molecule 8 isoform X1 [Dama dama]
MAQPHRATWLPPALLLLWVPGCLSLSGPSKVTGIVGGSLIVECRYREEFINNSKYWCKFPCMLSWKIVETRESEREMRKGRVSIKDHPGNLTFTVTLESLREEDEGKYGCGIDRPLSLDPTFHVEVSVIRAPSASPTPRSTRPAVTAKTSTITTKVSTVPFTTLATEGTTHSTSSQEEPEPTQSWSGSSSTEQARESRTSCPMQPTLSPLRLHALLISLALLLLLLGVVSLLAWRMVQRRVKAGEKPEPPQSRSQAAEQTEPCYANLELQTRPLSGKPIQPTPVEVEYSTVGPPSDNLHYTSVVFDSQRQDSKACRIPSETPVYSVIKKT